MQFDFEMMFLLYIQLLMAGEKWKKWILSYNSIKAYKVQLFRKSEYHSYCKHKL